MNAIETRHTYADIALHSQVGGDAGAVVYTGLKLIACGAHCRAVRTDVRIVRTNRWVERNRRWQRYEEEEEEWDGEPWKMEGVT